MKIALWSLSTKIVSIDFLNKKALKVNKDNAK